MALIPDLFVLVSQATKPGGTVVYLGFGPEHVELPIVYACLMEIDIKGTIGFLNE